MKIHHQRRPRCGTEAKDKHGPGRVKKLIFVNDFRGWMTLRTKQNRWHGPIPRRLATVLNSLEKGYQGRWPSVYNADKMRIPLDVWKNESQLKWCGYGSRGVYASGWGAVHSIATPPMLVWPCTDVDEVSSSPLPVVKSIALVGLQR